MQALRNLQPVLSRAWCSALVEARVVGLLMHLTPREAQVLECLKAGLGNEAIGSALRVSLPTVKTHLQRIMAKTETRSRAELLARLAATD